jgi:hypothetical protein
MIDKIIIGPIHYTVEPTANLSYTDAAGDTMTLKGAVYHDTAIIRVLTPMNHEIEVCAVWHETLHVLLEMAGFTEHPESAVIALGYALPRLLRENPALLDYTLGRGQYAPTEKTVHANGAGQP